MTIHHSQISQASLIWWNWNLALHHAITLGIHLKPYLMIGSSIELLLELISAGLEMSILSFHSVTDMLDSEEILLDLWPAGLGAPSQS